MKYKCVLFDLDGTLTDPGVGIVNGIVYALNKFGIEVDDMSKLYEFIGPPIKDSFMGYYGMSEEDALTCVKYYREYYGETGLFENKVYPDIPFVLEELKNRGLNLVVATSKPTLFSEQILEKFDLMKYFDFISGSSMDGNNAEKAVIISNALEKLSYEPNEMIMVGDRKFDVIGAKSNDMQSIGVLYGYGNTEELEAAGADFICSEPKGLLEIII